MRRKLIIGAIGAGVAATPAAAQFAPNVPMGAGAPMGIGAPIGAIGGGVAGGAGGAAAPQWTITPSLGLEEIFTDNVYYSEYNKRADVITELLPGLTVAEQGARSNLNVSYQPIIAAYAATPGLDQIDQNLIGSATLIPLEDRLEIDVQAYANENAANGNFMTPIASGLVPYNQRVLDFGGTISPHYQERFGDAATLDVFYRVNSWNTSSETSPGPGSVNNGLSSNELWRDANVIVGSADSFGPLVATLNLDHSDSSGSGYYVTSHTDNDVLELDYHINFKYTVSVTAGYQAIRYDSTATLLGFAESGLTWNVAFQATPNDKTTFFINYGRQQGAYDVNAQLNYDLAPRTLVTAVYSVQVMNNLQTISANLPFLTYNALGQPIDSRTGLPYVQYNQPFGQQNNLFRNKMGSITISHQFLRSTVGLQAYDNVQDQLGGAIPGATFVSGYGGTQSSVGVSLYYTREITPGLSGRADIGYQTNQFSNVGFQAYGQHDQYINFDVGLTYTINETLNANVTYSRFRSLSTFENNSILVNQLAIGITKSF